MKELYMWGLCRSYVELARDLGDGKQKKKKV